MSVAKIGIVGGTGYTGAELLRLLIGHPQAEVVSISSRSEHGRPVTDLFPGFRSHCDLSFTEPSVAALADCDLVFFATPHGVSMEMMPALLAAGARVVDLSADFRLKDAEQWQQWYGQAHSSPELLAQAVYGLPEINRAAIATAQLVAAPGCYPTAVQLGLLPLLRKNLVDEQGLVANAASGVSGAGRQAKLGNLFAELNDSFKAYGVAGHRHLPEIEQGLSTYIKKAVKLTFVPHLLPIIRGIHATLYARLTAEPGDLQALFEEQYASTPFVDVLPAGVLPETRQVKGSNLCQLAVQQPLNRDWVVVCAAIDNLVKGAAGQAVQCMNIMLGHDESMGLASMPLQP